ncbi:MAG: hypothetical protein WCA47_11505 [Terriglobales bacterium]
MIQSNLRCILFAMVVMAPCPAVMGQRQTKAASASKPADPRADSQLYRNARFAFRYQIPYGWVDRTQQLQEGNPDPGKSEVLLAVFERPPEATGNTVNSAVVIATESAASYPGVKRAEDYLGPLTELATSKGFKAVGDPYALEVESRPLLRADFVKALGGKDGSKDKLEDQLTMRQCTLVLFTKGQIVSFTFIAGGEEELDDLMDSLHFGATGTAAAPSKRAPTPLPH